MHSSYCLFIRYVLYAGVMGLCPYSQYRVLPAFVNFINLADFVEVSLNEPCVIHWCFLCAEDDIWFIVHIPVNLKFNCNALHVRIRRAIFENYSVQLPKAWL